MNFARPEGDLPRICARKISALLRDTNGPQGPWPPRALGRPCCDDLCRAGRIVAAWAEQKAVREIMYIGNFLLLSFVSHEVLNGFDESSRWVPFHMSSRSKAHLFHPPYTPELE